MPLRLLSSNIDTMQDEIPFSHLTKTFQDAIIACRRLGIHYLWADSLCIIQDSNQDWEEQCVMMSQVYSNSYCNIAAAHARDGSFGCFARRDPATVQPLHVDLNWGHSPGAHYVVWTRYWTERVLETPLNMRAWVFQERTLAPRNLFFGATEAFFECLENRASEHFPVQIPRQVGTAVLRGIRPHIDGPLIRETLGLEPDQSLDALSLWGHLVERFSLGRLTYATDKLVALSAIASEMQGHIQSDYLAGMWRRHLGCQLLWDVRGIQWLVQRSRPRVFVAPSWSWASVVGVVQNACSVRFADDRGIIIEILDAQINLANPKNHFGQVIGGFLRVRGSLAKSRVLMQKSPSGSEFLYLSISKGASSSVVFDNAQENSTAIGEEFYLLPIQHLPRDKEVIQTGMSIAVYHTSGIILRQTCPSKEEYIRVGKFEEFGDLEEFQSACRQTASWTGDGEEAADGWGPKRVLTVL
ncbi:heterokaryon incompatibility protein-domain-containing protein [Hypoxylon sp. FL1857]|nr:heterokaryon incompatibility protein-domain-containing protein [Hypoxylon sp. FL1857]